MTDRENEPESSEGGAVSGRTRTTPRGLVTAETLAFVAPELPEPCSRVLEVGCGEGDLARRLTAPGRAVVGLDTSAEAVARARAAGVDARQVDWLELEDGEPVDAVLFVRSLHHMSDLDAAVAKAAARLRPGGRVIVEDFAFAEVDARTAEWIRSVLRVLEAAGRVAAPADTRAFRLLAEGDALDLWFEDHHDIHPATAMAAALENHFRIRLRAEAPYLYRYVEPCLAPAAAAAGVLREVLEAERRALALGSVQPLGRRFVAEKSLR